MRAVLAHVAVLGLVALLACPSGITNNEDDNPSNANSPPPGASLTRQQRKALGIVAEHPPAAQVPEQIESVGRVLDSAALVGDMGELIASKAAAAAAQAEATRLRDLHGNNAGASLKMLEAARAESAKAVAQSQLTAARFAQQWTPLVTLTPADCQGLVAEVARGRVILLRADLPGRQSLGTLPRRAELDVDGIKVSGQVLGVLRQTGETQTVGLLVKVADPPSGLGSGARVPVALVMGKRSGVVLPREAVLYDERGPYVFKQLTNRGSEENTRYERRGVTLLLRHGGDWLVSGVDGGDDVVTEGAGVLWSLQGMTRLVRDEDD